MYLKYYVILKTLLFFLNYFMFEILFIFFKLLLTQNTASFRSNLVRSTTTSEYNCRGEQSSWQTICPKTHLVCEAICSGNFLVWKIFDSFFFLAFIFLKQIKRAAKIQTKGSKCSAVNNDSCNKYLVQNQIF